jgi:hypothetical protein
MMIETPNGTSSALKSSKQVHGTSNPAQSEFDR